MKKLFAIAMFLISSNMIFSQEVIALYDKVPGSKPAVKAESSETTNGILRIKNVSQPTLAVYKPEQGKANGTAVVICPGGGYSILAASHEGADIAKLFTSWGITAFVLKYRLPDDAIMQNKTIGPLQDAQRALQLIRQRAGEWGVNPSTVGIMGFSAGGHLAATASTQFAKPVIEAGATEVRPDFSILIYPVISFADTLMHKGSRDNLLGADTSAARIMLYSADRQVGPQTPPAFLVHAGDDKAVPVGNSLAYYTALQKNKVIAEMHIYQQGGHGFGLNNKTTKDQWQERLRNWLQANNWLPASAQ
ncbi:alpha/beta hydrolase [Terrimonas sp. NA20]|uniref:Alpha/beta hydrolase n=1 Tax=Terrimonas ginsenosidimutans TaxID=2908004 RepID=A0ABS9KQZ9_9BACT|nr:alpha/beta hydrolase [Terrimonas ginsenosidimutans]MCG2614751.1 alpha/beta hydrolase [Terrimonas ginsenosidimutans]